MSRFEQLPNNSQIVHYNNALLPVYAAHEQLSQHPDSRMLIHWHIDFEMIHIQSGHFMSIVNSENLEMKTGDFCFVNARHLHGIEPIGLDDCDYSVVLIDPALLSALPYIQRTLLAPLLGSDRFSHMHLSGAEAEPFNQMTERIIELCARETDAYELEIVAIAHMLIRQLMPYYRETVREADVHPADHYLQAQRSMLTYIAEHYMEKISLEDIASSGHVSTSTCNRLFRQYLQRSPFTYLTEYRLDAGSRILTSTDQSITETAQACGFSQQSYFCRQFQKRYQMSPVQYRKKHRNPV